MYLPEYTFEWNEGMYGNMMINEAMQNYVPSPFGVFKQSASYAFQDNSLIHAFEYLESFTTPSGVITKEEFDEKFGSEFLKILEAVKEKCFMDDDEKYTLYSSMKAVSQLDGSIAEVGTYKGGSAKILCELKDQKKIHLFDTFEGLPQPSNKELVKAGWLSDTSLKSVKNYLSGYNNIFFYKGYFPQTARNLTSEKFCLVHLDTDLYQSTLDSLEFFWPKMVKGGRIISHDYNAIEVDGVKQAFKEFFKVSPEMLIEIADTQILVVK